MSIFNSKKNKDGGGQGSGEERNIEIIDAAPQPGAANFSVQDIISEVKSGELDEAAEESTAQSAPEPVAATEPPEAAEPSGDTVAAADEPSGDNETPAEPVAANSRARGKSSLLWTALLVVCIGVMCFSGYKLIASQVQYSQGKNEYNDLADEFGKPHDTPDATGTPTPGGSGAFPNVPGETFDPDTDDVPSENPAEDGAKVEYVDNTAPAEWLEWDFDGLLNTNSDFVGWISNPGTNIHYPFVQREKDNEYYLTHTFKNVKNKVGAIFMDMRNSTDLTSRNTILYGHNMRNHSMFWTLTRYSAQAFYNSYPTYRIMTPYGNYTVEIFAGFNADPATSQAWRTEFYTPESFMNWVESMRGQSKFRTNVTLTPDDRVVTLSTCSYVFQNARFVVFGKLIPTDEGDYRSDAYKAAHPRPEPPVWYAPEPEPSPEPTPTPTPPAPVSPSDNGTVDADLPSPAPAASPTPTATPTHTASPTPAATPTASPSPTAPPATTQTPVPTPTPTTVPSDSIDDVELPSPDTPLAPPPETDDGVVDADLP
ncbi:MAG: class B sortase [Oscillospiraceae bacterium]|jgi:sortase B|nr:class B sortase [Oscillospiraceae bacterium]